MAEWLPWVIRALSITWQGNILTVQARTQIGAHLFLTWHWTQPEWQAVYRRRRGVSVLCGYVLRWRNYFSTEQGEYGETYIHSFMLYPVGPNQMVAMYLWSTLGPPGLPQQSTLFKMITPSSAQPLRCVLWIGIGAPAATPPINPVSISATFSITPP